MSRTVSKSGSPGGACDGFMVQAPYQPGGFEDFTRQVVPPELQKRGLFRTEYEGGTLRENLGLGRPAAREWENRIPPRPASVA